MKFKFWLIRSGIFLIFLGEKPAFAEQEDPYNGFSQTTNLGYIGEISSLYIRPEGANISPMTNDYLGKTDKLMTGSSNVGINSVWFPDPGTARAFAINLYWRAIMPSFRSKDGEESFEEPIGVFADWLDLQMSYALTKNIFIGGLKFKFGGAWGNISDRGIKYTHRQIHSSLNQPTGDLNYENQPVGTTYGGDALIAYILPRIGTRGVYLNFQAAAGGQTSKFMRESFSMFNAVFSFSRGFKLGYERKVSHQLYSEIYDEIEEYRFETSYSILWTPYFQPSVKIVSSYLSADPVGQLYVDLINVNIPF